MKDIDTEVIKKITENLIALTKALGIVNEGKEAKRRKFVDAIILGVAAKYHDKKVKVLIEELIEGEDVKVPIEYVMVYKNCILIVTEAKKYDFEQGRAQLLMQLYNAYIKNIRNGAPKNHIIYGIVTTGDQWEFIWCKGNDNVNSIESIKSNIEWKYAYKIAQLKWI